MRWQTAALKFKPATPWMMKTYTRETMREGDDDLAWEAEAYNESDKVKKK